MAHRLPLKGVRVPRAEMPREVCGEAVRGRSVIVLVAMPNEQVEGVCPGGVCCRE